MKTQYEDIINMPHHVSATRPQMSMMDRAAQFSPFAALTGYDGAIKETARLTDEKFELDDEAISILNMKLQMLAEAFEDRPEVLITYFRPDEKKAGGAYISVSGVVKKIDEFERILILTDGKKIKMEEIADIEGQIFEGLF